MSAMRLICSVIILSAFFSGVLYISGNYFEFYSPEEQYIEPTLPEDFSSIPDLHIHSDQETEEYIHKHEEVITVVQESQPQIILQKPEKNLVDIRYIPNAFGGEVQDYEEMSLEFLSAPSSEEKIDTLSLEMYRDLIDVRGKMKKKAIKMFGVKNLSEAEYLSVLSHEFGHYIDIYFFSQKNFDDISRKFYDISWESTQVVKPGMKQADFVSGYGMTNKYEDFGESFTYYMLHNKDFLKKAQKSQPLSKKYSFIRNYVFPDGEYAATDFSENNVIRSYYWDITKIPFDTKNFLQYLKNDI